MTKVSGMIETEDAVGKPTLVRRMSNMLKGKGTWLSYIN